MCASGPYKGTVYPFCLVLPTRESPLPAGAEQPLQEGKRGAVALGTGGRAGRGGSCGHRAPHSCLYLRSHTPAPASLPSLVSSLEGQPCLLPVCQYSQAPRPVSPTGMSSDNSPAGTISQSRGYRGSVWGSRSPAGTIFHCGGAGGQDGVPLSCSVHLPVMD